MTWAERERERAQRAVKDDLQAMAEVHRPRPPMRRPLLVFALGVAEG